MTPSKARGPLTLRDAGGGPQNLELLGGGLKEKSSRLAPSPQRRVDERRLRVLAQHVHECGARATFEAFKAVDGGADVLATLESYRRLDAWIFRAIGADAFPPSLISFDGGGA